MKTIKNNRKAKTTVIIVLAAALAAVPAFAFASQGPRGMGGWNQSSTASYASEPTEVVTSELTSNSAESLTPDVANAETIVMNADNNNVKISKSGTYIVTGTCADGNLAVKKGTTGVVLILKDLDLTSSVGATVSLNKGTEVKVIIEGNVTLTDAEDIADEESDDFDGAALKAKTGSSVVLTGTGTLNLNGVCKNGLKVSDLEEDDIADGYTNASFVIDGKDLTINITAEGDGMNSGTDLTIKNGNITVNAGDDGIKADYILTIGEEGTEGPTINVAKAGEAIEGATINICSGNITVNASDDGINAANKDLTDYTYSLNIMGGTINITAGADGIDSNGNINILGGLTTIARSASNGGEGGLDYEGSCYIKEGCLVNPYGTTMDSGKGGMGGNGGFPGWGSQEGQNGGRPGWGDQNGNSTMPAPPQGSEDGSVPAPPDGSIRDENGNVQDRGNRNGSTDRPQRPGENGTMPAPPDQGSEDGSVPAPTDVPSADTDDQVQSNWFQRLWDSIKNWFSTTFSK
jgi:hypothetical protein